VIHVGLRGSMVFCIEKPCAFLTTLLSLENWCLPSVWLSLRGSWCFGLYIVHFVFLLHFLHTYRSHLASHVILACICLILLIIVLG
jgi:peptidoglycan/LPS O-acetylase OafA/YrhL